MAHQAAPDPDEDESAFEAGTGDTGGDLTHADHGYREIDAAEEEEDPGDTDTESVPEQLTEGDLVPGKDALNQYARRQELRRRRMGARGGQQAPSEAVQADDAAPPVLKGASSSTLSPTAPSSASPASPPSPQSPEGADERSLPMLAGWLHKARRGMIGAKGWQKRWVTLNRRQVKWFADPDGSEMLGMVDFSLVPSKVIRLWGHPQSSWTCCSQRGVETDAPEAPSRDPRSCVPASVGESFLYSVGALAGFSFQICPLGHNCAIELNVPSEEEALIWVAALKKHMGMQLSRTSIVRISPDSSESNTWWKVQQLSVGRFEDLAQTGDVLLFRSRGSFAKLIRTATGSGRFDHVALLLRLEDDQLALLEATGNEGVGICTWKDFMHNRWYELYPQLALRRVFFDREAPGKMEDLQSWMKSVVGKPYSLTVSKLLTRKSTSSAGSPKSALSAQSGPKEDENYFCSQLVAEALKVLGVIRRGRSSCQFYPNSFSCEAAQIDTLPGAAFDCKDLTIDFTSHTELLKTDGIEKQETRERDVTCVSAFGSTS